MKNKNFSFLTSSMGYLSTLRYLFLVVVMGTSTSNIYAQTIETIDGLRYEIDERCQEASLMENPSEKYSGDIIVPRKVKAKDMYEYPVTALQPYCFNNCANLKSITIPSTVNFIGKNCFTGCVGLTSITIPPSVMSLGELCFVNCTNLKSINMPSSIISIGDRCFAFCSNLTSVTIPSSVTSLGSYCFNACFNLTSITIPSSVTTIGLQCFAECSSLTSVTIPSSVTSLGDLCFVACSKLETVYFDGKLPSNTNNSYIPNTCKLYVPKAYLQDYKGALGSNYPYIYARDDDGGENKPVAKCEPPTITFAAGKLQFSSPTSGAEYHYTILNGDRAYNIPSQDGTVELSATCNISAYATADGYQPSYMTTATLYWINANLENAPSTNINQAKTRGIVATSDGGIVTLSGLDNGEVVKFFSPDGKQLGTAKAEDGIASCAVTGSIVVAKVGAQSIKLVVK